jgi:ABC-type dipeptide/oligopeptide/nickel transport system permease subunit
MAQVAADEVSGQGLEAAGTPGVAVVGRTPWQIFWGRFRKDNVAIMGALFIVVLVLVALGAPLISKFIVHHDKNKTFGFMTNEFGLPHGPNSQFWFGGDLNGRDMFVRTIYGARTSLVVAIFATGISVFIGVILGSIAGFFRGWIDTLISRSIDIVMSLPILLFAIGIAAACSITAQGCFFGLIQPGLMLVVVIIALVNWTYIARIVRGQVFSLREREFIEAARSMGAGNVRIMFRELLPNLAAPIIVYSTLIIPNNILFEASLSFLGVGIPQTTPSWGRMLSDASSSQIFTVAWWMMFFPGVFLLLTTLAFNLVGDGLRDALDPKTAR